MRTTLAATAAALLLATGANAAINISNNGSTYSTFAAWSSAASGDGTFTTSGGPGDQLFKNSWYVRTQFNNTNRLFSSLDTPAESSVGNTATITYPNNSGPGSNGTERWNAQFRVTIEGLGTNSARVNTVLTFSAAANNSGTRTYQLFNLVDFDLNATAVNDAVAYNSGLSAFRYTEAANGNYAEHAGYGATQVQTSSGSSLRTLLNSGSGNLNGTQNAAAADNASAFQWTLTLAPGETRTIYASFAINAATVPAPGALALIGLGGLVAGRRRR